MKLKHLATKSLAFMLLLLGTRHLYGQTQVTVYLNSSSTQVFTIETSGKLYFLNDNLEVQTNTAATVTAIPISSIQKIVFANENTTSINTVDKTDHLYTIYPNPAGVFFKVKTNQIEQVTVMVFAVDGRCVLNGSFKNGEQIDVSTFKSGLYFVKINGETFKLVKQ